MSAPEVVAPKTRARVPVDFSKREVKLLVWLVHAVLRGKHDVEIQRTVTRKSEWCSLCAKIQQMDKVLDAHEKVMDEGDLNARESSDLDCNGGSK